MLSIGSGRETETETKLAPAEANGYPRLHQTGDALLSPSIERLGKSKAAHEIKFVICEEVARQVREWAAENLLQDGYAEPHHDGSYRTTTLYLDTPGLDVFRRSPGFRRRKFRVRRYGEQEHVFVERTLRRKDRLKKRRQQLPLAELALLGSGESPAKWPGEWFRERIAAKALLPACRVTYLRAAFVKPAGDRPWRLTLDREMQAERTSEWDLSPVTSGTAILSGLVVCELKYRGPLPALFKEAISALRLEAAGISKYRRVMKACGAVDQGAEK